MKRLFQIISATLVCAGFLGGVAVAQTSISNTGPESDNEISIESSTNIDIDCTNDIEVTNDTDQNATSGEAEVDGNTTGGNATSGNSANTNTNTTNVDAGCGLAAAKEEKPKAPEAGRGGAGVAAAPAAGAAAAPKVAALPKTGGNPLAVTGILSGALGSVAALSRVALVSYRRLSV